MQKKLDDFKKIVWNYYIINKRDTLAWRKTTDPYKILVSEIMLQQTQVGRVIKKYNLFISKFPTVFDLAHASLGEVLAIWQGLGYNRRAKYLKAAAEQIVREHRGKFPKTVEELVKLPGVGKATASAVLTYAFNKPIPFIETNIRTVFIHHFFDEKMQVTDSDLLELVSKTLDTNNPREWNFALMDYGTHLKQTLGNKSRQSAAYAKQSIFKGSWREKRGKVIRLLVAQKKLSRKELAKNIILTSEELDRLLDELMREGMITREGKMYSLG